MVKRTLIEENGVLNVTNLVIHSYGENTNVGSVDIEVEGDMRADEVTRLSRRLICRAAGLGEIFGAVQAGSRRGLPGYASGDPSGDRYVIKKEKSFDICLPR